MFDMPVPFPPEFRQRAIELARTSDKPLGDVATELGISRSCLQNWIRQEKGRRRRRCGRVEQRGENGAGRTAST
jgi:transposase